MYNIGGNKVKPIIAIISGLKRNKEAGVFEGELYSYITQEYVDAVEMCGGIPFIIPLQEKIEDVEKLLNAADGIILPGGNDIDPSFYHEETRAEFERRSVEIQKQTIETMAKIKELERKASEKLIFTFLSG